MAYFLAYLEEKVATDKRLAALKTARKNKKIRTEIRVTDRSVHNRQGHRG